MSADNREARSLMEQAKKTSERFFSFGKGKYEQAAEMYTRAGNLFKASKNCLCFFTPLTLLQLIFDRT